MAKTTDVMITMTALEAVNEVLKQANLAPIEADSPPYNKIRKHVQRCLEAKRTPAWSRDTMTTGKRRMLKDIPQ